MLEEENTKIVNLSEDEKIQVKTHHEASRSLNSLINMSVTNMKRDELEICLDTILPLLKASMLSTWDMLNEIKEKYKLKEVYYCPSDGEIYGRV